jgi:hypothetical protein
LAFSAYAGYAIGMGAGTALGWNLGETDSSISGPVLGALGGGVAGVVLLARDGFDESSEVVTSMLVLPAVGASAVAILTHGHDRSTEAPALGALLNVGPKGAMQLGVPLVHPAGGQRPVMLSLAGGLF